MEETPVNQPIPLKVSMVKVTWLKTYEGNAKSHPPEQVERLANSIKRFGFNNPVLAQPDGTLIAGHGRLVAAIKVGMQELPCIILENLSPEQARAYCLADNRLADLGHWDAAALEAELIALGETEPDMLTDAGFSPEEMKEFLQDNTDATDAGVDILYEQEPPPFKCPHCGEVIGDND